MADAKTAGKAAEIGTVISTFEGPSTEKFSFVLSTSSVRRGQFVCCENEQGMLIGHIVDITRANRYFERAESVAEYEKTAPISANFPVTDWEYTVANARALGIFKDNHVLRSTFPAAPGSTVSAVDAGVLKDFLGFVDGGLNIGEIENHRLPATIDMTRLLQKHLAILAMSGAGKSYLASVLIEELLDRKPEKGRLAAIMIDPHGEYLGFKYGEYADRTKVFDGRKVRIAFHKVMPSTLFEFMTELSATQKREVENALYALRAESKEKHVAYGLEDLMARIEDAEIKENIKGPLLAWLSQLRKARLFGEADSPTMKELARPGGLSIIDLSEMDSQKKKQMLVSYFSRRLLRMRKKGKVPPFALFIEEAHNFAPEKAEKGAAISRNVITTITREGRKFGASLCLISQRPVHLSTTALSQCNSNIILRVTNPFDVKHIGESCEGIDEGMLSAMTTLRVGEGLLVGEAVNHPVFVKIRRKKSRNSPKGENLEAMARRYEMGEEKKKEDVEAFI
ncbi:DNA double-strand break repair helicase HerA [Candidatus Burarchaeum australiense]|nr:DNA double-strand break repair helicase HerA [Candidatus Burarchaeum australiense]